MPFRQDSGVWKISEGKKIKIARLKIFIELKPQDAGYWILWHTLLETIVEIVESNS